ncbi:DUF1292 domain-containing protein [Nitrosomonas aestuarii]|uniref:DUF1292 domain-containing protein n=1 Tax=Nitrosomonas aestuarii TaxID=52441 RepID=UPI000D31E150|nr:DUF1292 domain-containing protein [Nitrosomonas aestuarii]PTN11049.1 hypothetical protein C8R11_11447 [Nitrosomonas aestuarii]
MNWIAMLFMQLLLMAGPVSAMQIEADPRTIISFMDKSLSPELDILRVTTDITPDNHLVFQVKTKDERIEGEGSDYLLLNIQHEKNYVLLIPLSKAKGDNIRVYEGAPQPGTELTSIKFEESSINKLHEGFDARHISRGAEFIVPLEWINFGADFGFDAYTVRAEIVDNALLISKVYDQARKGRAAVKQISAITLLNNICSPKK